MSTSDEEASNILKRAMQTFLREEPLGEDLARQLRNDAADEAIPHEALEQARAAFANGLFDGGVLRARGQMTGALTTFGTSVRRIRSAAKHTPEEMAARAGVPARLWTDIETQRVPLQTVEISHLASIAEAVQLGLSDLRATIRRSIDVGAVPARSAAFRADDPDDADSTAAYESLLSHVAARTGGARADDEEHAADELVERIVEELRRRGRTDLLELAK